MTLNEARDLLMQKYPGRTIHVGGDCWFFGHNQKRQTKFSASLHATTAGRIEFTSHENNTLESALADIDRQVAASLGPDESAEAVPEPVAEDIPGR